MSIAKTAKPAKPSADFPLFPHGSGQWARKINGKLRYFGVWSDPDAALARYLGKPTTPTPLHPESTPLKITSSDRPAKPSKDFPLYPHACGQWCRKIKGKAYYFGPWANDRKGEQAIKRYAEQRDDLLAGRTPPKGDGMKVVDLVNAFLIAKERKVENRELSQRTLDDYKDICDRIIAVLGAQRHVSGLRAADFEKLRTDFAKTHGPIRLGKDVSCTRSVFAYGYECDLLDRPVKFGPEFKGPSRLVRRKHRQEQGPKMFSAAEVRSLIEKAGPQLRAMIMLGVNCGLGNHDCALLTMRAIDLEKGWLDYPRPKTAMPRRCPLWPETIDAVKAAIAARPKPKDEAHRDRVFITKYGFTWEPKSVRDNPVAKETAKLLKELGINRKGTGFYALRHTFETIGAKTRDKAAVDAIMGHAEKANDMSAVYNEESPDDERLVAVTEYVRRWLHKKD